MSAMSSTTCLAFLEAVSKVPAQQHRSLHVMLIATCVVMLAPACISGDFSRLGE